MTDGNWSVGGVLDVMIGVPDLPAAIAYWEAFGYRVGRVGQLTPTSAGLLYGHPSGCRAARLFHQDSDHGLVRLVQWDVVRGPGLGFAPFKAIGSRWSAALVAKIARVHGHVKYAGLAGASIRMHRPDIVPAPGARREPFRHPIACAFEMAIAQPLYRQVLFERVDSEHPLYGRINPGSLMQASQFTHCCVVTRGTPRDGFDFYDRVLGLVRSGDFTLPWQEIGSSGRDILELDQGQGFRLLKFDDARCHVGGPKRSGRLTIFDFGADSPQPDLRENTRPGALGHGLYSLRLRDIGPARDAVIRAGATAVTPIVINEFGERAFTAVAPDGVMWSFVDATESHPLDNRS
jgi:catechol 2,3-dioxygenase-like lactoylglutathione lyase family enzyme